MKTHHPSYRKSWVLVSTAVCILLILAACKVEQPSEPEFVFPFSEEDFSISQRIPFDSLEDLKAFDYNIDNKQVDLSSLDQDAVASKLQDGTVLWGEAPLKNGTLKTMLAPNSAVYLRFKLTEADTCFSPYFWGVINQPEGENHPYGIGYGGCTLSTLNVESQNLTEEENRALVQEEDGVLILDQNVWVESLLWLSAEEPLSDGSQMAAYGFLWRKDNPQQYYAFKTSVPYLHTADFFIFQHFIYSGQIATDMLYRVRGEPLAYLYTTAPAFQAQAEGLYTFFSTPPGAGE